MNPNPSPTSKRCNQRPLRRKRGGDCVQKWLWQRDRWTKSSTTALFYSWQYNTSLLCQCNLDFFCSPLFTEGMGYVTICDVTKGSKIPTMSMTTPQFFFFNVRCFYYFSNALFRFCTILGLMETQRSYLFSALLFFLSANKQEKLLVCRKNWKTVLKGGWNHMANICCIPENTCDTHSQESGAGRLVGSSPSANLRCQLSAPADADQPNWWNDRYRIRSSVSASPNQLVLSY